MMKPTSIIAILAIAIIFAGCNKMDIPKDLPDLHKTVLTFTQEGKPLSDAEIILVSKDRSCRWSVSGTTDQNGVAKLKTHGKYRGAPIGTFIVTVIKTESEGVENLEVRTKPILIYSFVDKKYSDEKTSPLEIAVQKGSNNQSYELGKSERVLIETIPVNGA